MYRHLFIIIFLLCLTSCKDNRKEYYPTGELKAEYQVKDDQLHGRVKEYYKNGKLKEEAFYENGELEGIKKVYYKNGKLDYETEFRNGQENGFHRDYNEEGILIAEGYFKNGKQDSITTYYFPDGQIESETMYKNNLPNGNFREYYPSGQLLMYAIIRNDTTIYYEKYTKEGDLKEEYRLISIEFENDSIYFGEECKAEIKIHGPLIKKAKATIQLADSNLSRVPLKNEIEIKDNNYIFTSIPVYTGHFVLNLRVFINKDIYFHTADLYVLEKPES